MELAFSLENIKENATLFWKLAGDVTVIPFHGDMGAGKTTFIHALCDVKKVKDTVGSPTFSLINEYDYSEDGKEKKIFHIDLYRLNDENEAIQAGIEDCLYSGDICLVEWPEKAEKLMPESTLHVSIIPAGLQKRKLVINRN